MSLKGVLMAMGGMLAIALLFIYVIFPTFVCGTNKELTSTKDPNFRDPVAQFCRAAGK